MTKPQESKKDDAIKAPPYNADATGPDVDADKTGTDTNSDNTKSGDAKDRFDKPKRETDPDTTGIDVDSDKTKIENISRIINNQTIT